MAFSPSVGSTSATCSPASPGDCSLMPPARETGPEVVLRRRLSLLLSHLVVALVALVAIGGATRVMEAGLACPDWPLCYGALLPGRQMNLQVFLEWFHRLDAFVVGVALLVLAGVAIWERRVLPRWFSLAAVTAVLLVAGQGALGALTVTRLLAAPMVTAHLGTALLLVALLSAAQQGLVPGAPGSTAIPTWWRLLTTAALLGVFSQCLLGGAMASQWAADRCLAAGEACRWLALHRSGASPAALLVVVPFLSSFALPPGHRLLRGLSFAALVVMVGQVALGLFTLRLQLAVPLVTVAHQIGAALLVALLAAAASADRQPRPELIHG